MINRLKQFFLLCGAFLILAAFPVFGQTKAEINRQPLRDFSELVISRLQKNEIALSDNFLVEVSGELTTDGKFDRRKTRYVRAEGRQQMVDAAKSGIEAISDSGLFMYLAQLGSNRINLIFAQTDDEIYSMIKFELDTPKNAKTAKTSFDLVLTASKLQLKNEDEKTILDGATVSETDKTVTIKIAVEKSVGQEMIQRKLSEEINRKLKTAGN
jgi:hypothetical protein